MEAAALPQTKLLVVDDDDAMRTVLSEFLSREGYLLAEAADGSQVDEKRLAGVALVLLDVNLPGESGFDVVRRLRTDWPSVGIIMATGRRDLVDRVLGLELGADDYIQKPFALRELLARIRSVLRRRSEAQVAAPAASREVKPPPAITFNGWTLTPGSRKLVAPDARQVELTTTEFDIMRLLAQYPGQTVDRQMLYEGVRGKTWSPLDRTLDTHVANLRKKLDMAGQEGLIKTIHGQGYTLVFE